MLYVEHYLNPAYFPGIERFDLTRSLTDLYANHYGIRYGRVRFEMVPTILPAEPRDRCGSRWAARRYRSCGSTATRRAA